MASLFEVSSVYELLALHRALLEAKFGGNLVDHELSGSKFIVDMINRTSTAVVAIRPDWKPWFIFDPSRREWQLAQVHAVSQRRWWRGATTDARVDLAIALLAPFSVDRPMAESFVAQVDHILRQGRWYSLWSGVGDSGLRLSITRPDIERPEELVVLAGDGVTVLYRDADEFAVTEWLSANGYEFVADGLDKQPSDVTTTKPR